MLRLRKAAKRAASLRFNNLLHHVSVDRLKKSLSGADRQAATGVDGQTWEGYCANLQDNLQALHRRIHTDSYHPKPSRRIWISKPDGRQRPIGVAALEDKIVQQARVPVFDPQTGRWLNPAGPNAIEPRSGDIWQKTPTGFRNLETGEEVRDPHRSPP